MATEKPSLEKVEVRMYYTGFGDCFLLTFYYLNQPTPKTIWIDFGCRAGDADRMKQIANDICAHLTKQVGTPRVDVLVITHEHEDHISGFAEHQAQGELASLEIGELWFAWTENPENPLANEWRSYQNGARRTLRAAFQAMSTSLVSNKPQVDRLRNLFGFDVGTQELQATDKSVTQLGNEVYAFLRGKVGNDKKRIAYKRPGDSVADFAGVQIYVLGPPEDMSYVRKDQSSRPGELYLQANYLDEDYSLAHSLGVDAVISQPISPDMPPVASDQNPKDFWHYVQKAPFDEEFVLPIPPNSDPTLLYAQGFHSPVSSQYVTQFEALKQTEVYKNYFRKDNDWRSIDTDYLQSADNLAMRLNSATNNTSLVLAFELEDTGEVLFFPGDAQFGVWLAWQEDLEKTQKDAPDQKTPKAKYVENYARTFQWSVPDPKQPGQNRTVLAEDLLKNTILYKVGHHGSHNATPKRTGLEKLLSPNLLALIPVDEDVAQSFHWDEIPYLNLLAALDKRHATYVRSDKLHEVSSPTQWPAPTKWQITYELEQQASKCLLCTLTPRS